MLSRLFYTNIGCIRVNHGIELEQSGKCRCYERNFSADEQIVAMVREKSYHKRVRAEADYSYTSSGRASE
jgi:hypothetical protein